MAQIKLPRNFETIAARANSYNWSDEQLEIFEWFENGEGNLIIRARAGCAKTTSILEGVNRAPERRILLAAFNKSIADEMKSRVLNPAVRVQTLHALGLSFCHRHITDLQVDTKGERARALAKTACEALLSEKGINISPDHNAVRAVANLHTKIREILVDPIERFFCSRSEENIGINDDNIGRFFEWMQEFAFQFNTPHFDGFWSIDNLIEAALKAVQCAADTEMSMVDFADMIFLPLRRHWISPVCDLMVIDEAQDMSAPQLQIAIEATKSRGRICIVGDDKQAIYAFRGADTAGLDCLKLELDAAELGLKTTYRCPQTIVALAQSFAPDFRAAPTALEGVVEQLDTMSQIATYAQPGDFVLSRVNADLISACIRLVNRGLNAYVKGADLGKILDHLVEKIVDLDLVTLERFTILLEKWYNRERKRAEKLPDRIRLEKLAALGDQHDMLQAFAESSIDLAQMRERIITTFSETKPNAIMCSTVHKAKGLEAPRVFLLGKSFSREDEEEDNICYVAITRAKQELYIIGKTIDQFVSI